MIKKKNMKISFDAGLDNSMKVLKELKALPEIKKLVGSLDIGCFTNCRECGLTFKYMEYKNKGNRSFTWCVYEHRNSDAIIVNGKEGYISMSGDLPYKTDDKWDYLGSFDWKDYKGAARFLAKEIISFTK